MAKKKTAISRIFVFLFTGREKHDKINSEKEVTDREAGSL